MKLLLFSDIHCHADRCRNIVALSQHADIAIGAGDFACQRQGLEQCFACLDNLHAPFIMVPGNNEDENQLRPFSHKDPDIHLLHGSGLTLNGVTFYGVGGGIPSTPFGPWSYDFTEQEAEHLLRHCPEQCVLITHSPPQGVVDISSSGHSLGSTAIRQTILDKQPVLNVCGHIHGSAGKQQTLGSTTVINAGPYGIMYELYL